MNLAGSMTALPTLFRDGEIDSTVFTRLCQRRIEAGTSALVVYRFTF